MRKIVGQRVECKAWFMEFHSRAVLTFGMKWIRRTARRSGRVYWIIVIKTLITVTAWATVREDFMTVMAKVKRTYQVT
jgi:hypothetical protein